ncbi:MBL fold metallo-hydrolase [Indioceanicola profundi]|uniref:MBL fold metallo-hydrolase n=1 Tax=Indioceanicola profundi TaxID=2220096 RepID=UPI000E6ABD6C|nr:MBL fold metallo-hydrolase [Indioceanicola profundi]
MRIHHLNCGTMCPWGARLMDGRDRGPGPARVVCHVLLIETDRHGLVLVDTGLGQRDVRDPTRISPLFRALNRPQLRLEDTATWQVRRLGFDPRDVRHIVLTHLDFDHAGGLEDFPQATIHVLGAEFDAAAKAVIDPRAGLIARHRYRLPQWDDSLRWRTYEPVGEGWFGFQSVRDLDGLPPEILFVPLAGHTHGHSGVAVKVEDGWMLHAGDAYFHEAEMDSHAPDCPPGLRFYQTMMEVDRRSRLANQHRLRGLAREFSHEVLVFCAHDAHELEVLQRCRNGGARIGMAADMLATDRPRAAAYA